MPAFRRAELWTDLPNAGGSRLAFLGGKSGPHLLSLKTTRGIDATDSVAFSVPRNSSIVPLLLAGRAIVARRRDAAGTDSYDAWRLSTLTDGSGPDASTFSYQATAPIFDLARVDISQTLSTGETLHSFSQTGMTAAEIIDTFLIPCLAAHGLSYWSRGTIDYTAVVKDFSWSWWSALQLLQQLRDLTGMELDWHAVGTPGYAFDLVTQIGAAAPVAQFRTRRNLLATQRVRSTDQQVTRCIPRGDQLPDGSGEYHSIARMVLQVTNVAGAVVTLADPADEMQPIRIANQFTDTYLYRQQTGGTWQITGSDPVAQTVTLAVSPGTTPGTLAIGELVEFRADEPAAIRIAARPLSGILSGDLACSSLPYYAAAGGSGTRVVLKDAYDNSQPWPAFDGQYADDFAIFYSQILASNNVTATAALNRFEFPGSVASVAIGDLVYYGANNVSAKPYGGARSYVWEVTSIDAVNKYLFVKAHWAGHVGAFPTVAASEAFVIRASQVFQILTTHAATHELELTQTAPTFASAGGQIVLIERRLGGGRLVNYVDHPTAVQPITSGGYGVIARPLDKPGFRGEGNAQPNPVFAIWTTPTNPPDGYSVSGTAPSHSQNTDPALIKYAHGRNWLINAWGTTLGGPITNVTTPIAYLQSADVGKLTKFALKVNLNLVQFRFDVKLTLLLTSGDGTFQTTLKEFFSTDNTLGRSGTSVLAEGWQDIVFAGTDFTAPDGLGPGGSPHDWRDRGGLFLQLLPNVADAGAPNPQAVVQYVFDALAVIQVAYDPGVGVYPNGSYANLLENQAAAQLAAYGNPLPVYSVKGADLERLPNSPYAADALVKGGSLQVRDTELGDTSTLRLTRIVTDEFALDNSELTLASLPVQLTRLLLAAGT